MWNSLQTTNGFGSCVWRPKRGKWAIHPNLVRRSFRFAIKLFWESAQTRFCSCFSIARNWILIRDEGREPHAFSIHFLWQNLSLSVEEGAGLHPIETSWRREIDSLSWFIHRDQLVLQSLNYVQMIQFNGMVATFSPEHVTRNIFFPSIVPISPLRAIIFSGIGRQSKETSNAKWPRTTWTNFKLSCRAKCKPLSLTHSLSSLTSNQFITTISFHSIIFDFDWIQFMMIIMKLSVGIECIVY